MYVKEVVQTCENMKNMDAWNIYSNICKREVWSVCHCLKYIELKMLNKLWIITESPTCGLEKISIELGRIRTYKGFRHFLVKTESTFTIQTDKYPRLNVYLMIDNSCRPKCDMSEQAKQA